MRPATAPGQPGERRPANNIISFARLTVFICRRGQDEEEEEEEVGLKEMFVCSQHMDRKKDAAASRES